MLRLGLFFWCLLLALTAPAQAYFNERYPNFGFQSGNVGVVQTDSGFVACGQAYDVPVPGISVSLTLRFLDEQGRQRRVRYFGRDGYGFYGPLGGGGWLVHPHGGYVLMGTTRVVGRTQYPTLWRFAANGDTLWTRSYPRANERVAYSGCRTRDGGYALTGTAVRPGPAGEQLLLIRTDSLGNELWEAQYGTTHAQDGYSISQTRDGGFLLSGFCFTQGSTGTAPYVVKVDSGGTLQWERILGSLTQKDGGGKAIPTTDGGYLVAATRYGGPLGTTYTRQPIYYKLDSAGRTQWQRQIGPTRVAYEHYALHELPDGSFVAAGQQADSSAAQQVSEAFLVKLCPEGDSLWYRTYKKLPAPRSHNYLRDLRPTSDGGFVGAGFLFAIAPDTGTSDAWAFRVDSAGYLQAGGAPVTVQCRPLGTGLPAPLPEVGIEVWPNPSPDGRYALRLAQGGRAEVLDALGRVVWAGELAAGGGELDLRAQPAGLYLLRVATAASRPHTVRLLR